MIISEVKYNQVVERLGFDAEFSEIPKTDF